MTSKKRATYVGTRGSKNGASPEYIAWCRMLSRCNNPKDGAYKNYGGRGIKVSDEWKNFDTFRKDMGPKPSSLYSIERSDCNKNYCKENCLWDLFLRQNRNKRTTFYVDYKGKSYCLKDLTDELGLSYVLIWKRLKYQNLSLEEAISKPIKIGGSHARR